jgi:hypothetical protein
MQKIDRASLAQMSQAQLARLPFDFGNPRLSQRFFRCSRPLRKRWSRRVGLTRLGATGK